MNKIQTLPEYQELASRTCPDLGKNKNNRHMNLGVITEIGEALDIFKKYLAYERPKDLVNLGEELVDTAWYISNAARFQLIPLDDFPEALKDVEEFINTKMFTESNLELEIRAEAVLVTILSMYCSDEHHPFFRAPVVQIAALHVVAGWYGLDFFQCLTNNIEKLKVRYPDKFTNEAAQNRNLEAEREKLEVTGNGDGDND